MAGTRLNLEAKDFISCVCVVRRDNSNFVNLWQYVLWSVTPWPSPTDHQ